MISLCISRAIGSALSSRVLVTCVVVLYFRLQDVESALASLLGDSSPDRFSQSLKEPATGAKIVTMTLRIIHIFFYPQSPHVCVNFV